MLHFNKALFCLASMFLTAVYENPLRSNACCPEVRVYALTGKMAAFSLVTLVALGVFALNQMTVWIGDCTS